MATYALDRIDRIYLIAKAENPGNSLRMALGFGVSCGSQSCSSCKSCQQTPCSFDRIDRICLIAKAEGQAPDAATDAMQIAPIMFDAAEWKDRVLEAYRPKGAPLPKETVKKIMTYILKLDPDEQPPEEDPLARYIKEQERRYRERNSQAEPAGLL
jgi:hypothetical protein